MAISKKPKKNTVASEAAIKAVIEKGGSVAKDKHDSGRKNLQLRLETDLIEQIDKIRGEEWYHLQGIHGYWKQSMKN